MKRIEKILILILYTFGLFAIVGLIAVFSNNGPAFKDYTEKSQDENIAVVTQVLEQRKSAKELSAEYEKSEYNVHFFIKKTSGQFSADYLKKIRFHGIFIFVMINGQKSFARRNVFYEKSKMDSPVVRPGADPQPVCRLRRCRRRQADYPNRP